MLSGAGPTTLRVADSPGPSAAQFCEPLSRTIVCGRAATSGASVNFTGKTSMEVGVKVWQEERPTGHRNHVASAYLTFVSLDPETRKPRVVPIVEPETEDEQRRFREGDARRKARLSQRS